MEAIKNKSPILFIQNQPCRKINLFASSKKVVMNKVCMKTDLVFSVLELTG